MGDSDDGDPCHFSKIKDLSQGMPAAKWEAQHTALAMGCTGTNILGGSCWLPLAGLCCPLPGRPRPLASLSSTDSGFVYRVLLHSLDQSPD